MYCISCDLFAALEIAKKIEIDGHQQSSGQQPSCSKALCLSLLHVDTRGMAFRSYLHPRLLGIHGFRICRHWSQGWFEWNPWFAKTLAQSGHFERKNRVCGGRGRSKSLANFWCKKWFEWLGLSGLGFYLGCLMMSSNHEAILSKEVSPSVPETFGWNYLLQIEIPFQRFLGLIILSGFNSSRDFLPSVLSVGFSGTLNNGIPLW